MRVLLWIAFPALLAAQRGDADALVGRALACAQADEWREAGALLEEGMQRFPRDKRFPSEMAGVAYHAGDRERARRNLRRALAIDPADEYANDFLGTLYVLDGNLEAALRYWNRIGKPRVRRVVLDSSAGAIPPAAGRALAIAPGQVLSESRLLAARSPDYRLSLVPGGDGDEYDVMFQPAAVRRTAWRRAISAAAELPYQTLHIEASNIANSGAGVDSMWRWDPNRRRVAASVSVPVGAHPNLLFRASADALDENWDTGALFGMRKLETGVELEYSLTGRLRWTSGVFASTRRFDRAPATFIGGRALQFESGVLYDALRLPEHRLVVQVGAKAQGGPGPAGAYSKAQLQAGVRWDASPSVSVSSQWRGGKASGAVPFDELFLLGMDRDTDLWLRGHLAARGGMKGAGPLGRTYFLVQNEISRTLFRVPFVRCDLVPFLDVGRAYDFGPGSLAVDAGIESRFRLPGGLVFRVISGFDTRTGKSAIYTAVGR